MKIGTLSDTGVQTYVLDELEWAPDVDAAGIGVAVEDGTVSLSGEVDSYAERLAAKRAALRVQGVRTVVDNLVVHPKVPWTTTETDLAKEVDRALASASNVPNTVKAEIHGGEVTLIGEVDWNFQRVAAKKAVQYLHGVSNVNSRITLKARPSAADTHERIKNALTRHAQLDAGGIQVDVEGNKVTLSGSVRSWAERRHAADAAWASPHVTDVVNHLRVRPLD
jgi:osmotically-inducible protein OsmY